MTTWRRARPLLGTLVEVRVEAGRAAVAHAAIEQAFAAVTRVQALMSYHDPGSELSRINREAVAHAVAVSGDTWQVLEAAQRVSAASNGLFDITVAPALARAGFLPRPTGLPPASRHACWRDVELLPGQRVRFGRCLRIDLGGIAKGYAVDCAIQALQRTGIQSGVVNAGGDLRMFGDCADVVHLRHPAHPTALLTILPCSPAAATSAGYFQQRRYAGRPACAVVHPGRRAPCAADRSVTVLAADCMTADALTKVVYADPAQGHAALSAFCARAIVLEPDARTGELRLYDSQTAA